MQNVGTKEDGLGCYMWKHERKTTHMPRNPQTWRAANMSISSSVQSPSSLSSYHWACSQNLLILTSSYFGFRS
jgi:hypothetical protein